FPNVAILRNASNDFAVPDDAAAATALATGFQGNHRALSVDFAGKPVITIAELARKQGRAVGIVTNGSLAGPVPGAFYAHGADAREAEAVAAQMVEKFRPDVALGGGENFFLPSTGAGGREGGRTDGRNLVGDLQRAGVAIISSRY